MTWLVDKASSRDDGALTSTKLMKAYPTLDPVSRTTLPGAAEDSLAVVGEINA